MHIDTYIRTCLHTQSHIHIYTDICMYILMLNKNTWGVKKCGANQKQHCKQTGATKRFDIS